MAKDETSKANGWNPWRIAGWSMAALLVLHPLVAMQFTTEVNWTAGDFIFAALLLGSVGLAYELTVRRFGDWASRSAIAVALAAALLTTWANGAVGMIGDEGNPYNLLFLGAILIALLGSVIARFRPAGMAAAMASAGVAHASVAVVGMFSDWLGGLLSLGFATLWLLAAALLWHAARGQDAAEAS